MQIPQARQIEESLTEISGVRLTKLQADIHAIHLIVLGCRLLEFDGQSCGTCDQLCWLARACEILFSGPLREHVTDPRRIETYGINI